MSTDEEFRPEASVEVRVSIKARKGYKMYFADGEIRIGGHGSFEIVDRESLADDLLKFINRTADPADTLYEVISVDSVEYTGNGSDDWSY